MILPFRAWYYNQMRVDGMKHVITPPYDVITESLQTQLLQRSPYNFCHVDLPRETGAARYQKAKEVFASWKNEGILIADRKPAIYLHSHTFFGFKGERITRTGFFAACRIEDFSTGKILPHEKTLAAPKQDRLQITHATHTNLSPVFSLYDDPHQAVKTLWQKSLLSTPFMDFVSDEGERHQIWKLQEEELLKRLETLFRNKEFFIADGHHRYETAMNYRNEILTQNPNLAANAALRFVLMYFVNIDDPGLRILPIHRCLHSLPNFSAPDFIEKIKTQFAVETFTRDQLSQAQALQMQKSATHHAFLITTNDTNTIHLICLAHARWQALAKEQGVDPALAELDVVVLQNVILQNLLQISEEDLAQQTYVRYEKSAEEALQCVENGECQIAILLNPTKIAQMQRVAKANLKMPQKSTFFYPKVASGLILHSVAASETDGLNN